MNKKLKVTLLATSDIHGFYMPWDYAKDKPVETGGLARVSTIVNSIRKENPHTVLIDNGDLIQGNSAEHFLVHSEYPGIEAINLMNYEIYNMGNHEFNFGMNHLIRIVNKFKGIAMMGNLYRKKDKLRFMNGIYYKHYGDIKIGFISLNTPLVRKFEEKRGNLKDFDVTDADQELVKLLGQVGPVDALIGLFHMGDFNENNIPFTGVEDLITKTPGANRIDAVFAGHMHQLVNKKIGNTYFLEPGAYGQAISRYDLYFEGNKLKEIKPSIIEVGPDVELDPKIVELMKPYHDHLRTYINQIVGYTNIPLEDGQNLRGIPQTRVSQTKIGDFIGNVMLYYSKADVVAYHFDNLYPEIHSTSVRRRDIHDAYRYAGGEVSNYRISGRDLKRYMEWSAAYFNKSEPGDIHISFDKERSERKYSTFDIFANISYKIDLTKGKGSRIINLRRLDGSPILDDDHLIIGMNKYRMDYLTSRSGPLADRDYQPIWSSISDPNIPFKGNIRTLAIKYLENQYKHEPSGHWEIIEAREDIDLISKARDLINQGYLEIENLTESLNLDKDLSETQLKSLSQKFDLKREKTLRQILNDFEI